jgi:hypothetical protein
MRPFLGAGVVAVLTGFVSAGAVKAQEVGVQNCRISQFATRVGQEMSAATGQNLFSVKLTNQASSSCVLVGYPAIWLSDRMGTIPFVMRHGGDQMVTSNRPTRVLVRPGRSAFVVLNRYRCDLGNVRTARALRLGLPGATRTASILVDIRPLRGRVNYCGKGDPGSTITVSPFEPTVAAGLRRH